MKAGAFALLASVTMSSCTDGNDWGIDSMFDRLFGTSTINVTKDDRLAQAVVTWSSTKDTQYYIIELSTKELNDSVPMGGDGSIVFGNDAANRITASPDTLRDLAANTTYYIRIKSVSDDPKKESRWVYGDDSFTTVENEQALNVPDGDDLPVGTGKVRLSWEKGLNVDHISYAPVGSADEPVTHQLTDSEKANGEAWIEGLKTYTKYTFTIYNGETARGSQTVEIEGTEIESEISDVTAGTAVFSWDASTDVDSYAVAEQGQAEPDSKTPLTADEIAAHKVTIQNLKGSTTYTVYAYVGSSKCATQTFRTKKGKPAGYTEMSFADAMANWDSLTGNVLVLVSGTANDFNSDNTMLIPDGVRHLVFYGEGIGATLNVENQFDTSGSIEKLEFDNLTIDGGNMNSKILVYHQKGGGVKDVEFNSCTIKDLRGIVRMKKAMSQDLNVTVDDCIFTNIGSYGILNAQELPAALPSITFSVSNSTFINAATGSALFRTRDDGTQTGTISLENCTVYGNASGQFTRAVQGMTMNLSNVLFANGALKLFNKSAEVPAIGAISIYVTSDYNLSSTDNKPVNKLDYTSSQMFPDATSTSLGKFGPEIDGSAKVGDQRYR